MLCVVVVFLLSVSCAATDDPDQCLDGLCSADDDMDVAVNLIQRRAHVLQTQTSFAAGRSNRTVVASKAITQVDKAACSVYTSTVSPDGLDSCETDTMPYSYGYHFHVTYDTDSDTAAIDAMDAFMEEFNIGTCENTEETGTLYAIDESMCVIISAKTLRDSVSTCETCIFPVKFFSVYMRAEVMFDNVNYPTSPWQWMALHKNDYGADLDVFVHPLQRCPNAGHALWSVFVNDDHNTAAAADIDNAIDTYEESGNNGCYGLQSNGCDTYKADDNTYISDDKGECALSGIAGYPAAMTDMMALSYQTIWVF
jgi:hypothetical protein